MIITSNMTAAETAVRHVAGRLHDLTADQRAALRSNDGLTVEVDLTAGVAALHALHTADTAAVAVWHREGDDMLVGYHNPLHPEAGEEWFEVSAAQPIRVALDAAYDLAEASALPGFHDLDDEAREALVAAYERMFIAVARRRYGTRVDVLIPDDGAAADDWLRGTVDLDATHEVWQAIHDEIGIGQKPDRIVLDAGADLQDEVATAPAVAFAVGDADGPPEVLIVERAGTGSDAYDGEPDVRAPWAARDGDDAALDRLVASLGYRPMVGATWQDAGNFATLAVRPAGSPTGLDQT